MQHRLSPAGLSCALSFALAACAGGRLVVGDAPDTGLGDSPGLDAGVALGEDGGRDPLGGDGAAGLKAHVERPGGLRVSVLTLSCDGPCADVIAVAEGGHPPYAFTWRDGITGESRRLCAGEDEMTFVVEVRDTSIEDGEFSYEAQRTMADVRVDALSCPDAGPPESDCAGPIGNPSFEGTVTTGIGVAFDAPPWQLCSMTPTISTPHTHGATSAYISDGPVNGVETIGQALCSPFRAGEVTHILLDVWPQIAPGTIRFFASSSSPCGEDELIGETELLSMASDFQTVCVALRAQEDRGYLKLRATTTFSSGFYVDNIRVVDACP